MPETPVYGLPFQALTVAPHGPDLGEDLANAIEAELVRIDGAAATLLAPGWTDWVSSVAWTSSGSAPSLGNAGKTAGYHRAPGQDILDGYMTVQFGNTSTFGTGVYFWALPVPVHPSWIGSIPIGWAYGLDQGTQEYGGIVKCETATTCRMLPASNNTDSATNWGPTAPFTWGNGDFLSMVFRYRPA